MLAVGGAIILAGYALVWWGWSMKVGNGNSLSDLVVPGHYEKSHASKKAA